MAMHPTESQRTAPDSGEDVLRTPLSRAPEPAAKMLLAGLISLVVIVAVLAVLL